MAAGARWKMKQAEKAEAAALAASGVTPGTGAKSSGRMARVSIRPAGGARSPGKPGAAKAAKADAPAAPRPRKELLPPMTKQQRDEFVKAFGIFDKAKAGSLSFGRVAKLASGQGYPVTRGQVANLAQLAGVKGPGELTADQFVDIVMAHVVRQPKPTLDDMVAALERLPAVTGGSVSGARVQQLLTTCGEPLDEEELESLSTEAGLKPDASVTVRHLLSVMMTSE